MKIKEGKEKEREVVKHEETELPYFPKWKTSFLKKMPVEEIWLQMLPQYETGLIFHLGRKVNNLS